MIPLLLGRECVLYLSMGGIETDVVEWSDPRSLSWGTDSVFVYLHLTVVINQSIAQWLGFFRKGRERSKLKVSSHVSVVSVNKHPTNARMFEINRGNHTGKKRFD